MFNESLVLERFTVINIAWSYHKTQQFSHLIADQMKFEAIEPSYRTLTPLSYTFKDLMHMNTLVPAYAKQCAVYETDSGAFPHAASLRKEYEWDYNSPLKFSKPIVCDCLRKQIGHMFLNFIDIEMLETLNPLRLDKIIMVMISAEDIFGSR